MFDVVPIDFYGKDVRVIEVDGKPWFCRSDIAVVLGIINPNQKNRLSINTITMPIETSGGIQGLVFIDEASVYRLLFQGRKPKAKIATDIVIEDIIKKLGDAKKIIDAIVNIEVPDEFGEMYIYAVKESLTGNIKLGISHDPVRRVKELQIANSSELELVWYSLAKNKFKDERAIHEHNSDHLIRGEWFDENAEFYEFN